MYPALMTVLRAMLLLLLGLLLPTAPADAGYAWGFRGTNDIIQRTERDSAQSCDLIARATAERMVASIEQGLAEVSDAVTDLHQARFDTAASIVAAPLTGTAAVVFHTVRACANAAVNISQGQYGNAMLGIVPGAGGSAAAQAIRNLTPGSVMAMLRRAGRQADEVAGAARGAPTGPVRPFEVGTADGLRARSARGDGLDIHHAGQAHPFEQIIPGYDRATGPAIAIPQAPHRTISTVRGPYTGTARDQLAKDIRDLRNFTDAPNRSLRELIGLNRQMYPSSFAK